MLSYNFPSPALRKCSAANMFIYIFVRLEKQRRIPACVNKLFNYLDFFI